MALPNSRNEFKGFCLRQLGKGAVRIEVTDEQVEDCIDRALFKFSQFHIDGTIKNFYKYQITSQDRTNGYIEIPENIIGVVKVLPIDDNIDSTNIFSLRWQIALSDVFNWIGSGSLLPYYLTMQRLEMIGEILVGKPMIRFDRHQNRLYIDIDWEKLPVGKWVVVECYNTIDPVTYTDIWTDDWLIRYCTALIKKIWGNNLKKFSGQQMPGGVTFSGQQIYDEAEAELQAILEELANTWSLPTAFFCG